jgi:four helix bundle protein
MKTLQDVMPSWPEGWGHLKDQINRAMASAILNLVEGNGRVTPKDRRRFFVQSCASLAEVDACLDLLSILSPKHREPNEARQRELHVIYAMIRRLP